MNSQTVWSEREEVDPRKQDSFDFGMRMATELALPYVLRRRLKGRQRFPVKNAIDGLLHSGFGQEALHMLRELRKMNRNFLPEVDDLLESVHNILPTGPTEDDGDNDESDGGGTRATRSTVQLADVVMSTPITPLSATRRRRVAASPASGQRTPQRPRQLQVRHSAPSAERNIQPRDLLTPVRTAPSMETTPTTRPPPTAPGPSNTFDLSHPGPVGQGPGKCYLCLDEVRPGHARADNAGISKLSEEYFCAHCGKRVCKTEKKKHSKRICRKCEKDLEKYKKVSSDSSDMDTE